MKVGVVVAAYQAERFLHTTLVSIASQSHASLRCVVVDDGSTDATFAIAREFADGDDRFSVVRQDNGGVKAARNHGYQLLGADVDAVTFMDADDVWLPGALARLVGSLQASPSAAGAHGLADYVDLDGQWIDRGEFASFGRQRLGCRGGRPNPWPTDRPTCFETVITQSILFPPGLVLIRRDVLEKIGLYDEVTGADGDWDLLIRVCRDGDLAFTDEVILAYRRHPGQMSTGAMNAEACRLARVKAFYSGENDERHRHLLTDSWRAAQVIDASVRWRRARDSGVGNPRAAIRDLARIPLIAARWAFGRPYLSRADKVALGRRNPTRT